MNLPGAYQTDPVVSEDIGRAATSRKMGLYILLHGTPCQWDYHLRPWIYFEQDISGKGHESSRYGYTGGERDGSITPQM